MTSCRIVPPPAPPPTVAFPEHLAVLTRNVRILGDGWELRSGGPVRPPFRSEDPCVIYELSGVKDPTTYLFTPTPEGAVPEWQDKRLPLLDGFDIVLQSGGRFCRVETPAIEKALYGVLTLNPVYESSNPTARRAYRIAVPPGQVQAATGGRIAAVYEPYEFRYDWAPAEGWVRFGAGHHPPDDGSMYASLTRHAASWILWMSDVPFPGQNP